MPRRLALAPVAVLVAATLSSCGGDDESEISAPTGYLPADSALVISLSTDLESDQWAEFEDFLLAGPLSPESVGDQLGGLPPPTSIEGYLTQLSAFAGLDYEDDVEPLLGGRLVVGVSDAGPALGLPESDDAGTYAALETGDGEKAAAILEALELTEQGEVEGATVYADESGFTQVAIDGDVLIGVDGNLDVDDDSGQPDVPNDALAEAIERERSGEGLASDTLAPPEGAPDDALLAAYGDLSTLLERPEIARAIEVPWVAALESFSGSISFEDGQVRADGLVNTDPEGLTDEDLPLATDVETPEIVVADGEVSGASANQSRTTVFLLDLARAAFPDSRFVEDVETVERELGIDFEQEFLLQFDGPSASTLPLTEEFSARSEIADPEAMSQTLEDLAPDIGRLVQDLQALQGRGLIPLFLFAPDAPIAPGVLPGSRIDVSRIPGEPDLYRIQNLVPPDLTPATPVPTEIVFGLIDGVFVVASDEDRAREIAAADLEPVPEGVEGASVAVADLAPLTTAIEEATFVSPGPLGELRASLEADVEGLRGTATVELGASP